VVSATNPSDRNFSFLDLGREGKEKLIRMGALFIVSAVLEHNSKSKVYDLGRKYTEDMCRKIYLSVNVRIEHKCSELNGAAPVGSLYERVYCVCR
jgi:hypothetical protein